jgi:multidrug resistance protein MdtO
LSMAAQAQSGLDGQSRSSWFREFLKQELAPYPGRAGTTARMVTAATLVMFVGMTFRIPYIFQGAIFVLLISRESIRATLQMSAIFLLVTAAGTGYLLVSAWFVAGLPMLRFLWVVGSLFLAFYALSALTSYTAAVIFAVMISVGIPIWDRHVPAETNVEDTLWLGLAVLVGVGITVGIELLSARLRRGDEAASLIADRLSAVAGVLTCYAQGGPPDSQAKQKIVRFEMLGTSLLRRILRRSNHSSQYCETMAGVTVLAGRLVDLAAALTELHFEGSSPDRKRFADLAAALAGISDDLRAHRIPRTVRVPTEEEPHVPLLGEMEKTLALISQVFASSETSLGQPPPQENLAGFHLLVPDAFANPRHFQFALKACLAASACYVIYNAVDWPGISTAVTTCLLTALSSIGVSHQKQVLRLAGAVVGGFLFGMGSQVFLLPNIDSITGFGLLFAFVTAVASWFMTSSPRLSYFGLQLALAFYLVHLQEFKIQTSLSTARDRVVGILLGLSLMWLVFDKLWGAPAAVEMKRTSLANLQLLAQFAGEPPPADLNTAIRRQDMIRETINNNLDRTRALADGVLFEFGPTRRDDLALRERIRKWQSQFRTLFILRTALIKYRLRLPGFELPQVVEQAQQVFDTHVGQMLSRMHDRLEGKDANPVEDFERSFEHLQQAVRTVEQPANAARLEPFLSLSHTVHELILALDSQMI